MVMRANWRVMNLESHACAMLMTDKLFVLLYHTQCYNGHKSIKHNIITVIKSHGIKMNTLCCSFIFR